jgi:predicted DNA-binding protein
MELVTIRLPEEVAQKLKEIAAEDGRPLSNLVRLIIVQWLKERGHIEEPPKK